MGGKGMEDSADESADWSGEEMKESETEEDAETAGVGWVGLE